jgi:hypothetical protein
MVDDLFQRPTEHVSTSGVKKNGKMHWQREISQDCREISSLGADAGKAAGDARLIFPG